MIFAPARRSFASVAFVAMAVCSIAQRPISSGVESDHESALHATSRAPVLAVAVAPPELKRVCSSVGFDGLALAARSFPLGAPVAAPGLRSERIGASNGAARARLRAHPPHGPPQLG